MIAQDVGTALHENNAATDAIQELREFAGDNAAAEHDHTFRDEIEFEYVIARPERSFCEAGKWRRADAGTRGDKDAFGSQAFAVVQFDSMRVNELCVAAE